MGTRSRAASSLRASQKGPSRLMDVRWPAMLKERFWGFIGASCLRIGWDGFAAPGVRRLVKALVVERGISVLFTEHSMDVVFAFADRIIVMARGKLIADGDARAIRNDPQVVRVYFGSGRTFERTEQPS